MSQGDQSRIDPAVVAALYVQHAAELRRFLHGVLRDPDLASDVLQSTFVKAVQSGHQAREDSLKGWLFRVAANEALAVKRRRAVGNRATRQLAWSQKRVGQSPEDGLIRWEAIARVRAALEELPEEQRQVVQSRIYEEKTFAAIAKQQGVPLGTVLSRMQLALQKLRQKLIEGR